MSTRLRRLRVGHDLDGCYYLFDYAWWAGMAALTPGFAENHAYRPATRWEFYEDYGLTLPGFLASCDALADHGLLWNHDPEVGAVEAWEQIAEDGHENHVYTDRSFGTHPIASEVGTRLWLSGHRFPYESLTITADKPVADVDVMIEDKLANYDALDAAGTLVYLLDRPWNRQPGDSRRRIYSTAEYVTRVRALARESAA